MRSSMDFQKWTARSFLWRGRDEWSEVLGAVSLGAIPSRLFDYYLALRDDITSEAKSDGVLRWVILWSDCGFVVHGLWNCGLIESSGFDQPNGLSVADNDRLVWLMCCTSMDDDMEEEFKSLMREVHSFRGQYAPPRDSLRSLLAGMRITHDPTAGLRDLLSRISVSPRGT